MTCLPRPRDGRWLGAVVPKRHARRAVTRSLLKRQIRARPSGMRAGWRRGLWLVRLRAPFDRARFASAASPALRAAARAELDALLARRRAALTHDCAAARLLPRRAADRRWCAPTACC